jgi:hypothetical protein
LIGIGVGAERDMLALPRGPCQLDAQQFGRIDLDDDLALEVAAGVEAQVGVRGTSKAEFARMGAASIRIDRPAKRHPRGLGNLVEDRLGSHFVEIGRDRLRRLEMAHDRFLAVSR